LTNFLLVARSPAKLRTLLETTHNISPEVIDNQLTIIEGSVKDIAPVKQTIAPFNVPAAIIVSGIGARPKFSLSLKPIQMDDVHICEMAMTCILAALRELRRENVISADKRPLLCTVSTTGISNNRDVPLAMAPLYHGILAVPHRDKKITEALVAKASMETGDDAPISGFVIARPTLLNDGPAKGLDNVRMGWEKHPDAITAVEGNGTKAAMGYQISRADVGLFIFEGVIKGDRKWAGKCVSLTY
jgi:hypothetical protein